METIALKYKHLAKALEDFAVEVRNTYQDKLISGGKIASGNLLNSAEVSVEQHEFRYDAVIHLEDYWKWVEGGRKPGGKLPPISKLVEWVKIKPVLPRPAKNGRIPTPEGLAWAIAKKIQREGVEPFPALAESVEEVLSLFAQRLAEALAEDIGEEVSLQLHEFKGFAK